MGHREWMMGHEATEKPPTDIAISSRSLSRLRELVARGGTPSVSERFLREAAGSAQQQESDLRKQSGKRQQRIVHQLLERLTSMKIFSMPKKREGGTTQDTVDAAMHPLSDTLRKRTHGHDLSSL